MRLDVDIAKTMTSRGRTFRLVSSFSLVRDRVVLFGPSGSGKSLTLQAIAGLLTPDAGHVRLDGEALFDHAGGVNLPARARRVGYMFQEYALFPHLSLRRNVEFGLSRWGRRLSGEERDRVDGALETFGLGAMADSLPGEVSGGQRQRTALARILVLRPRVLLLDEPFSALDAPLKTVMRGELTRVLDALGIPLVLVTHDPAEVAAFAQAVVLYRDGHVVETVTMEALASQGRAVEDCLQAAFRGESCLPAISGELAPAACGNDGGRVAETPPAEASSE